ncbi:MAG: peptide ABC transporter ATP-binding protein, partial [Coriobacteriales bacterium]
ALDVTIQAQIMSLLYGLCEQLSMSCVFITHDLALIQGFCERLYVLDSGSVVEEGNTEDIFSNPKSQSTRNLLASVLTI